MGHPSDHQHWKSVERGGGDSGGDEGPLGNPGLPPRTAISVAAARASARGPAPQVHTHNSAPQAHQPALHTPPPLTKRPVC